MDNFIYYTPTKVYFGKGEENNVGKYIKDYHPHKVLIHYGGGSVVRSGLLDRVKKALDDEGISWVEFGGAKPNPELDLVKKGIEFSLKEGVDFVLAVGGGSVLDSSKDIAHGIANNEIDTWGYHTGEKKLTKSLRKGCILTLAAAGSEMSNSSVITNTELKIKKGFNSDFNRFDFAICNPELTYTVSKYQTACGAVDIAMHTIERFFALGNDTELTDDIALAVIKNAFKYGKLAYDHPDDYNARANMMWASSLAHNGLTGCGRSFLLTVHQLEHEVSALYPEVAHGAGLAALWCSWARYVYKANVERWYQFVSSIWGVEDIDKEKAILKGIGLQEEYYRSIGMPIGLKELGIKEKDLEYLANRTSHSKSRIIPGYKPLEYQDILNIFNLAYNRD